MDNDDTFKRIQGSCEEYEGGDHGHGHSHGDGKDKGKEHGHGHSHGEKKQKNEEVKSILSAHEVSSDDEKNY